MPTTVPTWAGQLRHLELSQDGPVLTLTLDRPDVGNALSARLRAELDQVVNHLDADDSVSVVLVHGSGRHFCLGYDLAGDPLDPADPGYAPPVKRSTPTLSRHAIHRSRELWLRLWRVRQATVGVVHGTCLAGGVDLIGVLDVVFAAEDALIGQPQARTMGELHVGGMWPLLIGMRRTLEWLLPGDPMTGTEAAAAGLVNRAVPGADLPLLARTYADRVARVPLDLIASHKDATHRWFEAMGIAAAMASANDLDALDLAGPGMDRFAATAARDGVRAAIAERDAPFTEHRTYWEEFLARKSTT